MEIIVDLNIDFPMLKKQKTTLIEMQNSTTTLEQYETLEGIVNLIDTIQDQAVEKYGIEEREVFNLTGGNT